MAETLTCSWCSAEATVGSTTCPDCGAALRMHDGVEVLKIPGVTVVDPGLESWAAQPLHIPGASPSQAFAGSAVITAASGAPGGLAALGALGAIAAAEYLGAAPEGGARVDPERVGQLDPYIVDALERFDRGEAPESAPVWPVAEETAEGA